jgi:Pentapeptide repeats (8 copies)
MSKRWAAWPQGVRWLAGIAAVVLALAIVWALFVPVAGWLAHYDVGSAKGPLHETALDNARSRLLTLGAGLFAAGALVFTARNFTLSREGQVTDRYTKAIEQLGSDKLDVRIGGIYALERIARDSARDHPTVMEVLTAFIREHSHEQWPPSDHPASRGQQRSTRPDIQAGLTVVGRRDLDRDIRPINLAGANLTGADLAGAYLADADLIGADLTDADLTDADLAGADLEEANLTSAHLTGADLAGADLEEATLTGTHLHGARWPELAPVPEGWKLDTSSGRLVISVRL